MKNDTDGQYIYCTQLLGEIERIREACGYSRFKTPLTYDTATNSNCHKIDSFNALLRKGADIGVTHTTFLNATPETIDLLRDNDYTLIIDEVLDVFCEFNKLQTVEGNPVQKINKADVALIKGEKMIKVEEKSGRVTWTANDYFIPSQRQKPVTRRSCGRPIMRMRTSWRVRDIK